MELLGKIVAPKRAASITATNEEILVNVKSSRLTLSLALLTALGWSDKAVGFGYDPAGDLGSAKLYIYGIDNVEEGCKIGKSGTVTNKVHTGKIADAFASDIAESNRFKLDVNVESPVTHESGTVLYPVTFLSTLADITRKAPTAAEATADAEQSTDLDASTVTDTQEEPIAFDEAPQEDVAMEATAAH